MAKNENTDELIVVDAKRYNKVKKALEASKTGEPGAAPPILDEHENTRELVVVDVRRYKKVKKALEASEERYRQLFENVPIGIYRTTPDGRIVDANPALVKMLGYDSFADLTTRNLEKEYANAGSQRADFIKLLEREGEIRGLEAVWKKKGGAAVQVRENAKLVRNDEGQVFFEGTVEDITQGKLAEEAQRIRTQQIEILNCIISKGNMAESLEQMLEVILDCMVIPLAFDTAGIFMYDQESKRVQMLAHRGTPTQFAQTEEYMAIEKMPFSMVLQHGQAAYCENAREEQHDFFTNWGWRMAGSVPLLSKGRVVGALNVASCRRDAFTPEEKDILEMIGKEAGTLVSKLQTETALRESEKYYRTLIDTSPDIIVVTDLEAKLLTVNQQFLKVGGYFYDEVIGKSTYDFVSGLDRIFLEKKTDTFIKKKKVSGSEYEFKNKKGQAVPLEVSASVLVDEAGHPAGIIAIGRDISERKLAERELRESKALLDAVVDNVPLMIFLKEATDLKFVIFNRAGEELLGHERGSLLGKNNLDLFPAEQAAFFMAKDRETLDSEADLLDIPEEPIMTAKKGQRLLHTRKLCIRGADGTTKYLLGISEDITERKEAEAKLLAYQEKLRALTSELTLIEERERRRIASELHDQIGQNLALCKLKVAALEKGVGGEELKGELSAVRRLLECSIQDTRSLIFDLSPPVLYELGFPAALEWLAEWIGEQYHVPVEFEKRSGDEPMETDRQVILFQVVRELLVNVGKHSRASRAKVILSMEKRSLKVQVNDDGVGFDATRIYDPKGKDSGFGFFSMRERLNYLGGGLEVYSKPGQGTQIILLVPQGDRPDAGRREDA
jgi:PAS domain S-box-containing protein